MNYIKNLETGKVELHFDKAEYNALTDAQKTAIKGAYLWSNYGKCWVSRAKEPNTWRAEEVAKSLGMTTCEKVGERLSYAEQLERKAERAERRAERYEEHAANAERRAQHLQSDLNSMRGDIAFFTQPIIAGHSGSQAFARRREKMYARYEKGIEEYRKGEYYQERAAMARATANNGKLNDKVYLVNRIKECEKKLRDLQKCVIAGEERLYKLQQGEVLTSWNGENITLEAQEERLEDILDLYEAEQDKLSFFEDCLDKAGGVQFSLDNIKVGYIVEIKHWGKCEIVGAGPKNITFKILEGGASGGCLTETYAAINKVIETSTAPAVVNPYKPGDILCAHRPADNSIYRAFQVLKATEKGIQLQEIVVRGGIPQANSFRSGSKPERKRITKSKYSDYVGAYYDDWQLHKYTA